MPVTVFSVSCKSYRQARKPWLTASGARGWTIQEARQAGGAMRAARVVLHGARAERVEAVVDGEVASRQPGVVAHHLQFRHLRQRRRRSAQAAGRQVVDGARRRLLGRGATTRGANVENGLAGLPPSRLQHLLQRGAERLDFGIRALLGGADQKAVRRAPDSSGRAGSPPTMPAAASASATGPAGVPKSITRSWKKGPAKRSRTPSMLVRARLRSRVLAWHRDATRRSPSAPSSAK